MLGQIIRGISYLHANYICHRDIKPENILFIGGPPGKGVARVKIIDFGCACYFHPQKFMHDIYGSPNYIAPEMIEGEYDCKVDVFSAGILYYMMLTLKLPFQARDDMDILRTIKRNNLDYFGVGTKYSFWCYDLLSKMLCKVPSGRFTAHKVYFHPWFKKKGRD